MCVCVRQSIKSSFIDTTFDTNAEGFTRAENVCKEDKLIIVSCQISQLAK